MSSMDRLRTTEAAVVSRVSLRDVNRIIDEHILPQAFVSTENGRHVLITACPLIAFYFDSAKILTARERLHAITAFGAKIGRWGSLARLESIDAAEWTIHRDYVTIDLAPFVRRISEQMGHLKDAQAEVVSSHDILGGTPVLKGTRVPVYDVAAAVASGLSMNGILAMYPSLDATKVEMASLYARANPARGRPVSVPPPSGSRIIVERTVPRRGAE